MIMDQTLPNNYSGDKLMDGILDLESLLKNIQPEMSEKEYVFCSVPSVNSDLIYRLNPIGTFKEDEGLTLILEKKTAESESFQFNEIFKKITLQVHSSLAAVGLTAAVSAALADVDISANVIAAYYHDHIFVPIDSAALALKVLQKLSKDS